MGTQRYHVVTGSRLSRRAALRGAGLAGLGGAAAWLVACSSSNNNKSAATATKSAATVASATSAAASATTAASATSAATRAGTAAATRAATSAPAAAGSPAAAGAAPKIADFGWTNNAPDLKAAPKKGGTLRFSTHVTPPGLDPVKSASYESANIYTPVYNRLIRAQYGTELQPYNPWRLMITTDLAAAMPEHPDAST